MGKIIDNNPEKVQMVQILMDWLLFLVFVFLMIWLSHCPVCPRLTLNAGPLYVPTIYNFPHSVLLGDQSQDQMGLLAQLMIWNVCYHSSTCENDLESLLSQLNFWECSGMYAITLKLNVRSIWNVYCCIQTNCEEDLKCLSWDTN